MIENRIAQYCFTLFISGIMAEIKFNVKAKTLKDKLLFKCSIMYIYTCLQSPSESWTKQNSVRCLNTAAIELQNKEEKDICIDFIEKMEREDSFANDVHKSTLQMFKTVSSVQDKYNGLVEIDVPEGYVTFTFHFSEDENLKTFLGDIHKKDEQLINTFSRIILNSSFLESFNAKPRHLAWNVKEVKIFKGKLFKFLSYCNCMFKLILLFFSSCFVCLI